MQDVSEDVWDEYARRKRAQRLSEARQVWDALTAAGGGEDTVLAVDFIHFAPNHQDAHALQQQMAENYACTIESGTDGYWIVKGTTRPYGVTLSAESHTAWVGFMCDVARSHGCTFSGWSLSIPSLDVTVSSEAFEGHE